MPSLNITYTDDELEAVRAQAAAEGKSLKQYVHDLSVREQQRTAFVSFARSWSEGHQAEFDEAFPDEAPPPASRGAAAA
ncbi:hypothetical protein [Streptomyces sp. NPDC048644]|uniref:hypothetical protein n=1 Tax=Streptomyces sp. NPDC048644 TaxID=3365582 RepID=UPI0037101A3D